MKKLLILFLLVPFLGLAQSPMSTDNTNNIKLKGPSQLRSYNMYQELIDRVDLQTAGGTNTYTIPSLLGITSYSGLSMRVRFTNHNTATSTLNINSLGAKTLKNKATGANLVASDLVDGGTYTISYDGTNIQVDLGGGGGGAFWPLTGTASLTGDMTINGTNFMNLHTMGRMEMLTGITGTGSPGAGAAFLAGWKDAATTPNNTVYADDALIKMGYHNIAVNNWFEASSAGLVLKVNNGTTAMLITEPGVIKLVPSVTPAVGSIIKSTSTDGTLNWGQLDLADADSHTGLLPIANGGTATATPGLVAGTNITITGSWPNQTINSSAGGGSNPFDDGTALVKGSADATKLLRFEVDGFTTGTTRVLTPPNFDGIIATTNNAQTITGIQTFSSAPVVPTGTPLSADTKAANQKYVDDAITAAAMAAFSTTVPGYTNLSGSATKLLLGDNTWTNALPSVTTAITPSQDANSTLVATAAYADRLRYLRFNRQTSTPYTLVLADALTKAVEMNFAGANVVIIPTNASVPFIIGSVIEVAEYGTGTTTIQAFDGTVILRSSSGTLAVASQYNSVFLEKVGTNEWYVKDGTPTIVFSNGLTPGALTVKLGGALTQNTSITGAFNWAQSNANFNWTSTYTGTSASDQGMLFDGTITARATASDVLRGVTIAQTLVSAAATQVLTGLLVNTTFTDANSATQYLQRWQNAGTDKLTMQSAGTLTHTVSTANLAAATRINVFTTTANIPSGTNNPVGYQFKTLVAGSGTPNTVWSAMFSTGGAASQGFAWDASSTYYLFLANNSATNSQAGPYIKATTTNMTFEGATLYSFSLGQNSTGTQLSLGGGSAATSSTAFIQVSQTGTFGAASGSANARMYSATPVLNWTGTATGVLFYNMYYAPTVTSLTGATEYAWFGGHGQYLFGASNSDVVTANARLDVRGIGTTSGLAFRVADSGNTLRFSVTDGGAVSFGGTLTSGDISTGATSFNTLGNNIALGGATSAGTSNMTLYDGAIGTSISGAISMGSISGHLQYRMGPSTAIVAVGGALYDYFTDANNTSTTETDLYTSTTVASLLSTNGDKIIARYAGNFNDLTATCQLRIYFGGTLIGDTGLLTVSSLTADWTAEAFIIRTGATTVRADVKIFTPGAGTVSYSKETDITGLTLSSTNIVKITGTAAGASGGSSDITAKLGGIMFIPFAP